MILTSPDSPVYPVYLHVSLIFHHETLPYRMSNHYCINTRYCKNVRYSLQLCGISLSPELISLEAGRPLGYKH